MNMKYQVRHSKYDSQHDSMTPNLQKLRKVGDLVPEFNYNSRQVLDPPFENYHFQNDHKVGNRKNVESDVMS